MSKKNSRRTGWVQNTGSKRFGGKKMYSDDEYDFDDSYYDDEEEN